MAINTVFAAVYYPLPFDGNRQNRGAPPMRCAVFPRALPWPDGRPNLNGLCPGDALPILLGGCTPWRSHTLATDSKKSILQLRLLRLIFFKSAFCSCSNMRKTQAFVAWVSSFLPCLFLCLSVLFVFKSYLFFLRFSQFPISFF